MQDDRLELAFRLIKMGKIPEARTVLEFFLKENRNHVSAWKLYAETWPNVADQKRVWGYCLRFNPENQQAQQALADLSVSQPKIVHAQPVERKKRPAYKKGSSSLRWLLWGGFGFFTISVLVIVLGVINSAPKDPAQYRHSQPVEYYLYVPKSYSAEHEWPLFVGIHGSGGSGLECWNLWQPYAEKEGFILLCPSIPGDGMGYYQDVGESTVWSAVKEVQREYRVSTRMFFAGFSAGAYFIQGFAYHYPNAVSGLAILSTGYYVQGIQSHVPMLLVIGGADHPDSIRANEEFFSYMKQNGFDIQYKTLPGVGHWATNDTKELTIELFRKTIGK